jgi:TPR repeat protein
MTTISCCAECGEEGGGLVSLKACKSCMLVMYCNANCQKNHWPTHKKQCKLRAAELHDEALFKDPPPKEDCPICFLPLPSTIISCISLPDATILSVPIFDFANANDGLSKAMVQYYYCCGKSICRGCSYSFNQTGNNEKCPFCNAERTSNPTFEIEQMTNRAEANDAGAIWTLASCYYFGRGGLQQDHTMAMELFTRAAELGDSMAHFNLGFIYREGGDLKKSKLHLETAAMAGSEMARCSIGSIEFKSGNIERAIKHWTIAASAGYYSAMNFLRKFFEGGLVSRESMMQL